MDIQVFKEVTVSPSSAFLAKNQLASDEPKVVQPVVILVLGQVDGNSSYNSMGDNWGDIDLRK